MVHVRNTNDVFIIIHHSWYRRKPHFPLIIPFFLFYYMTVPWRKDPLGLAESEGSHGDQPLACCWLSVQHQKTEGSNSPFVLWTFSAPSRSIKQQQILGNVAPQSYRPSKLFRSRCQQSGWFPLILPPRELQPMWDGLQGNDLLPFVYLFRVVQL